MTTRAKQFSLIFVFAALCAAFLCVAPPFAARAHRYHTSFARVEYNRQAKTVEVMIQTFSHDLEAALERANGKRVNLDTAPDIDRILLKYLSSQFVIKNAKGKPIAFKYVGKETQTDAVYIYVEAAMPTGFDGATLENRFLFEMFDDQTNLVTCLYDGKRNDLVFRPNDKPQSLTK